jgi:hypothetical protein
MIANPIYGGADWLALMPNAHESYVSWEKAEAIRKMVSDNVPLALAIVAFNDDGDLFAESHDVRLGGRQSEAPRQHEADMLVLGVTIKMAGRRFQDLRGRQPPGRNTPTFAFEKQCGLRLGAGKTELSSIAGQAPRGVVHA